MRSFIKSHRKNDSSISNAPSEALLLNPSNNNTTTTTTIPITTNNNNITSHVVSNTRPGSNTNSFNSASDDYQPPTSYSNRSSTTPIPSPKMQQHPQFTPPQTGQSSISSPKKLLTPIKNLFTSSSHSKSSLTTPTSGESLIVMGGSPKNKFRKHVRSRSHISISNDLSKLPEDKPKNSLFDNKTYQKLTPFEHEVKSSKSKSTTSLISLSENTSKPVRRSSITLFMGHKSTKREKPSHLRSRHITSLPLPNASNDLNVELGPPIALSHSPSFNTSNPSIAESESKFHTKQVAFDSMTESKIKDQTETQKLEKVANFAAEKEEEEEEVDDDDDEYDSSSSQFSFVQDMKGGRNTSVKYYKTKDYKRKSSPEAGLLNTFNEYDLGYDVDEFSDYDYENNGADIDDDDDDAAAIADDEYCGYEEEDDVQYNKFYDDDIEDVPPAMSIQSEEDNEAEEYDDLNPSLVTNNEENTPHGLGAPLFADNSSQSRNPFNRSFHLSIMGPKCDTPKDSPAKSNFEEDILENYLDISELPSITNSQENLADFEDPSANGNFELFALNSPIINGLTIGNNLRHRAGRHRDFTNTNRLIIHRKPIEFYDDSVNHSGFTLNENDGFTKYIHSFHGSFEDGINKTIHEKVKGFEEFWDNRKNLKPNSNNLGLGIIDSVSGSSTQFEQPGLDKRTSNSTSNSSHSKLTTSDVASNTTTGSSIPVKAPIVSKANNPIRQSVSDMMAVLGSLEMSNTTEPQDPVSKDTSKARDSVVNMMGVLENLESNLKEEPKPTEKSTNQLRNSIIGMMDVLANLENVEEPKVDLKTEKVKEDKTNLRNSVIGMMDLLANLEQQTDEKRDQQQNRKSVVDMLSTLSALQGNNDKVDKLETLEEPKRKASFKRYSWFNSQENLSTPTKDKPPTVKEYDPTDDNDKYNTSLDQELLDEINQIPDDFDFDEAQQQQQQQQLIPLLQFPSRSQSRERSGFYRSNSYNRKPKKTVVSNQLLSNKIETLSKTVTFYNSGTSSPASSLASRSRSLSRGPSTRSMNSFASVNEEEEEEEENEFDDDLIDDELLNEINDDLSYDGYKSNDLGTINESFDNQTYSYRN